MEKAEAKVLLETLESIPRSFDAANLFYKEEIAPIFEVILLMTTSAVCIDRVHRYYSDFVVSKENIPLKEGDITVAEWIGDFKPDRINVIPLFEDMPSMLRADEITQQYLKDKNVTYQRVFLARSDPAMNYGFFSALLLNKVALSRLQTLSRETGVGIFPIIGVGSAPFRGNLKPETARRITAEYPSVHTFTIQSAFKYDNISQEAGKAIQTLRESTPGHPMDMDEARCLEIIEKYHREYQRQIMELAGVINEMAKHVPSRRKRKLHIGLFGYSRRMQGIRLPRVITFTAALYSLGLPPEVLGLNVLNEDDIRFLKQVYVNFEGDLMDSLKYLNIDAKYLPEELRAALDKLGIGFQTDEQHKCITGQVISSLDANDTGAIKGCILQAASLRKFLG